MRLGGLAAKQSGDFDLTAVHELVDRNDGFQPIAALGQDVYRLAGLGSDSSSLPTGGTFLWRDRLSEVVTAANQGERTALSLPVKALFAETEPARMTRPPAERS